MTHVPCHVRAPLAAILSESPRRELPKKPCCHLKSNIISTLTPTELIRPTHDKPAKASHFEARISWNQHWTLWTLEAKQLQSFYTRRAKPALLFFKELLLIRWFKSWHQLSKFIGVQNVASAEYNVKTALLYLILIQQQHAWYTSRCLKIVDGFNLLVNSSHNGIRSSLGSRNGKPRIQSQIQSAKDVHICQPTNKEYYESKNPLMIHTNRLLLKFFYKLCIFECL